jgi:hypothetical protein
MKVHRFKLSGGVRSMRLFEECGVELVVLEKK